MRIKETYQDHPYVCMLLGYMAIHGLKQTVSFYALSYSIASSSPRLQGYSYDFEDHLLESPRWYHYCITYLTVPTTFALSLTLLSLCTIQMTNNHMANLINKQGKPLPYYCYNINGDSSSILSAKPTQSNRTRDVLPALH